MIIDESRFRMPRPMGRSALLGAAFLAATLLPISCAGHEADSSPVVSKDAAPVAEAAPAAAPAVPPAAAENRSKVFSDVRLSPAAKMQAEKFNCICGCNLRLSKCFCEKTPGSIEMKLHLQQLVDQGLSPKEIEDAMVAKFGQAVIP